MLKFDGNRQIECGQIQEYWLLALEVVIKMRSQGDFKVFGQSKHSYRAQVPWYPGT
jgi:hypothetical protein